MLRLYRAKTPMNIFSNGELIFRAFLKYNILIFINHTKKQGRAEM